MKMTCTWLWPLLLVFSAVGQEYQVKEQERPFVVTTRGVSKAQVSKALMTPSDWLPFAYIIADGTFVKVGDIVATFDSTQAEFEYKSMLFEKQVVEQQLKYELTEIDNDRLAKNDKLEADEATLKIQRATLKKLREYPLKDEVLKAQGKYRISQLEYDAAMKEFTKAQSRYKREFISKTELDKVEQDLKVKKASLDYAKAFYEYTKLPVKDSALKIQKIRVKIAELNVAEQKYELSQLATLQSFEKKTAKAKKAIIDKRLKRKKSDLDNTVVKAPIEGYVKHFEGGKRLSPGARYWREFRFADIPDVSSIVFESQLSEGDRKFFKLNDPVEIYVTGRKGQPLKGLISQIAGVPIDLGEKETRGYGSKVSLTGIKIYSIKVKPLKFESWMKSGMNAEIKVFSSKTLKYPAIPVKYLKLRDGKNYLSVGGIYQEVAGFINQGWFMVETTDFKVAYVQMDGEFPEAKGKQDKSGGRFMTSGELLPVTSTPVIVPKIHDEGKILWLEEEEAEVKKGDVLIRMGAAGADKAISKVETKKTVMVNKTNTLRKKLSISKKENEFNLAQAKLLLDLEKIRKDVILNDVNYSSVIKSKLSYLRANISYEDSASQLQRLQNKKKEFVSKVEIERAIRDEKRKKLQLETARINYDEITEGSKAVVKKNAELVYLTQEVKYKNQIADLDYKEAKDGYALKSSLLSQREVEVDLQRQYKRKKNLTILSPADGIIRYSKVWDNGLIDKITVGTGLMKKMTAMTIPNLSELFIRVEVPEKYYRHVKSGQKVKIRIPALGEKEYAGQVKSIEYMFKKVARQDTQLGIYSSQEPLGQTIFNVQVSIDLKGDKVKPGVIADIYFPFRRY